MQNENNRQRLEKAFPPMDAAFDHAVRSTLENIVQEDTMQVKRPLRVLAITLALVICLAGTALAVGNGLNLFNFFEVIGSPNPTVQPEAYTLTAHDVASHSFEHTDVAVREAAWAACCAFFIVCATARWIACSPMRISWMAITICPARGRMASRPIGAATMCMSTASACA